VLQQACRSLVLGIENASFLRAHYRLQVVDRRVTHLRIYLLYGSSSTESLPAIPTQQQDFVFNFLATLSGVLIGCLRVLLLTLTAITNVR
jgi:hypothetical protein